MYPNDVPNLPAFFQAENDRITQETTRRRRGHHADRLVPATDDTFTPRDAEFPVLGSGGSRLLSGNSWYAEELEEWIASFHERATALLFNSGYDANIGLMSCIPQAGDVVVCDELVHNSMRVSRHSL